MARFYGEAEVQALLAAAKEVLKLLQESVLEDTNVTYAEQFAMMQRLDAAIKAAEAGEKT